MRGYMESCVLDRRSDTETSYVRGVVGENLDLGQRNDIRIVLLRCREIFATFWKLST